MPHGSWEKPFGSLLCTLPSNWRMSWTWEEDWKRSEGLKVLGFFLILGRLWWQVLSSFCFWDVNSATLRFFIILTVACQQRNARNARNRWASNGCHWDTYFVWFSYAKHVLSWRGRCHCVCDSAIWHPLKLVKLARDLTRPNPHEVAEVSGNPLVSGNSWWNTPWKINGWNLQITHEKKGTQEHDLPSTSRELCSSR